MIAKGLHAKAYCMASALPRHGVDVTVGVINQPAKIRSRAEVAKATAETLIGESVISLVGEGDADRVISGQTEGSGGIERNATNPFCSSKANSRGVD